MIALWHEHDRGERPNTVCKYPYTCKLQTTIVSLWKPIGSQCTLQPSNMQKYLNLVV